jgi:hypothetical protein
MNAFNAVFKRSPVLACFSGKAAGDKQFRRCQNDLTTAKCLAQERPWRDTNTLSHLPQILIIPPTNDLERLAKTSRV